MQLHQLQPKTTRKDAKRIGRGGKRGKTSGKGGKGQTARAGGRPRPEMRDIIKRIPKLRGHGKNRARTVNNERVLPIVVNLSVIEKTFAAGDTVSPQTLLAVKAIALTKGKMPQVKILGTGEITKKITLSGCTFSASTKAKIEKAGGTVL
jgi:large subunit ribosomal protein L15